MYRFTIVVCLTVLVLLASLAFADIPRLINYQGMLTDDGGNPLNETVSITFKVYTDSLSVSPELKKWEETQTGVEVVNGLFNVMLGRVTVLELDFSEDYWLDITVGGEHQPERLRFVSVGYAYRALVADSARVTTPGSGSNWSITDSVLHTDKYLGIARGGAGNVLYGDSGYTMVNLGVACTTGASGHDVGYQTVSGGYGNSASWWYATVGGGELNSASGMDATVGGGRLNNASGFIATVGGGDQNIASNGYATVGGGVGNKASQGSATVGGGFGNTSSGIRATVGGGFFNTASGDYSMVPGGIWNTASGEGSFAAGSKAKALHAGSFVWADTNDADFASTGANQFLIRASGGVGIGTNDPRRNLHIVGDNPRILIEASSISPEVNFKHSGDPNSKIWALYKNGATDDFRFYQNGDRVTIEDGTGNVGIGTTNPGTKLAVSGLTATSSYNWVKVNTATGDFYYSSSSKRYKEDIQPLEDDFDRILQVEPKSFVDKASGQREIGYIAEEFDGMGLDNLVIYDEEGQPDGLKYDLVSLYLLEVIKDQVQVIEELKTENEELKHRVEALEDR